MWGKILGFLEIIQNFGYVKKSYVKVFYMELK
jgi:hypothetical protein